ncbi:MAG TPA: ABC transporter substrate-binding protein, partial [Candidatus Limnocylindrales bacterium]|nr:ABC transporter substrate-binding protein [Candidatus Limnocylindrales bacterium]
MRIRLAALLGAATIVVAACGTGTPSDSPTGSGQGSAAPPATQAPPPSVATTGEELFDTSYAPEAGTDGGSIIIGDWQEANQFNPYYASQVTEANVASATWSTLFVFTHDYKYGPDLAADIPTTFNGGVKAPGDDGDAMTVTWTLRDGLKWSDGEDLTCDDFKYAWEWVLDEENVGVVTTGFNEIGDVECASDTEMVLHYTEIYEGYIATFTAPLPRHYLEAIPMADQVNGAGFRADEVSNLPTSGAFKFESVTPQQELRLAKNPNYTSPWTGSPAHLDNLIWKWYGDADLMIAGFKAGEVDFATDLQDSDLPKVQDLGEQVSAIASLTYEFLRPNWSEGPFDAETKTGGCSRNPAVQDRGTGCPMADPAMREAVAFAVNKEEINSRLLGGTVDVANTNVSPSAWFFADQTPATFDPAQAQQILEDAGWTDSDGDGIREKDGLKAKIELC